ncbi:MAG: hypothetical protein K6A98_00975 [Prevotella sp.]|nr:hypothetical protein [Prevotella sp.]
MKRQLLLIILACNCAIMLATDYFAAPGAKGSGTSVNDPGDLNILASKTIAGGDNLYLLDGVYYITKTVDVKEAAGTAGKMTFVGAYEGAHPIIDGSKLAYNNNGQSNGVRTRVDYVHLYGITVRYAGFKGFLIGGNHNKIEKCTAQANVDSGFGVKDAEGCTFIDCDSFDNFDYQLGGTTNPDFGGNADGFCDKQFSKGGNTYINCRAWNNSDDGWDLYKRGTSSPIVFINCITYNNSPEYYDFTGNPRLVTDKTWFDSVEGQTMKTSKDHTDTWSRTHYYNNGNKNGFKIGGANMATDVTMYRCLAIANTVKGFDQNYTQGTVKLYNCTGYDNKNNYHFGSAQMAGLDIKNCISFYSHEPNANPDSVQWKDIIKTGNYTHSSNSWDMDGMAPANNDFLSLDATLAATPREADGTMNIPALMCLANGSKFIDAGEFIEGYDDYEGWKPDLGWKEYYASVGDVDDCIDNISVLNGARRLNVYNLSGKMVGMVHDGNIDALNLQHGIYIVRDFDSNKAVKIRR